MSSRTRSSDTTSAPALTRTQTRTCGQPDIVYSTSGYRTGSWRWMNDVVTPNFKKRSNAGEIIISPMTRYQQDFTASPTGYQHSYTVTPPACPTSIVNADRFDSLLNWKLGPLPVGLYPDALHFGYNLISDATKEQSITLAATAALSDWKSASMQSMVFLAELRKTIQTLRNPIQALAREIAIGRKKGFSFKGSLRGVSGEYLTWFYGIRSLMFDIDGAKEAILRQTACMRETGRGSNQVVVENVTSSILHLGSVLVTSSYNTKVKHTHIVRAGLVGDVNFDVGYSRGFGYRLSDIPSALWELTPWSFVLDWGVNLGDFIESLFTDVVTGVRGQWITTIDQVEVTREVHSCVAASGWAITGPCSDKDSAVYLVKQRSPSNLADYRGISLRTGFDRVPELAALALTFQQLTKR